MGRFGGGALSFGNSVMGEERTNTVVLMGEERSLMTGDEQEDQV